MSGVCCDCAFFTGRTCTIKQRVMRNYDTCARYQPDPEYVAALNAKHEEDLWKKKVALEDERRRQDEERHREEEKRRMKEERRRHYEEVNGEPYTPVAVRAALGIAAHFFKK